MPRPPKIRHFSVRLVDEKIRTFRAICVQRGITTQAAIDHLVDRVIDGTITLPLPTEPDDEPPDEP